MNEKIFEDYIDDTRNCYEYGSSSGCNEYCPVLNKGKCEHWKSVEEFLLENN